MTKARRFFKIEDKPGNTGVTQRGGKKSTDPMESYKPGKPICQNCGLNKNSKTPYMSYSGKGNKRILVIGGFSGQADDTAGKHFSGKAGKLLEKKLKENKIDLREDCWSINAIGCRFIGKGSSKKPSAKQIKCCRPKIIETIQKLEPKYVWVLGESAIESLLGERHKNLTVTRWERICIPDQMLNVFIVPIYHPSHILRKEGRVDEESGEPDRGLSSMFDRQLKFAVNCLGKALPILDYKSKITLLTDAEKIINLLLDVEKNYFELEFDYETTGKKPYRPGHRIESISLCIEKEEGIHAYSFPFMRQNFFKEEEFNKIKEIWIRILENSKIKKVAHNLSYEDNWSRILLNCKVNGWEACTMNTAHILDDRKSYCSLKFQAFIHWGIDGYDWKVKHFLGSGKNEEFNTIDRCPLHVLLEYGAYDALFTKMLREKQKILLNKSRSLKKANKLWFEGVLAFSELQITGIGANEDYFHNMDKRLGIRINKLQKEILETKEAIKFRRETGKEINPNSPQDLQTLLFGMLKFVSTKKTDGGGESTDVEALNEIDIPFVQKLLQKKKLEKIKGTYLAQFIREVHEGVIHPNSNLHRARTYRSSNSDPNFQNIPVRDADAKRICRNGIFPFLDQRLGEIDYGSLEVRIAACYTQDPVLVDYIVTGGDMHADQAVDIFKLPKPQVHKDIRFYTKNGFVFPEFYGGWYKSCATNIWDVVPTLVTNEGEPLLEHMKSKDLGTKPKFENHLRKIEKDFWNKFRVFKTWQGKILKDYEKKGYVEMFFGHRRGGYLKKNEIINAPIQGTGFHCLLWTLIELLKESRNREWVSKICGQIHDSIIGSLCPTEQREVVTTIIDIGCNRIREQHKWLIVPLEMEIEFAPINKGWYNKKEVVLKDGKFVDPKTGQIYDNNY